MANLTRDEFIALAATQPPAKSTEQTRVIPLAVRLLADQLTPVLAYRRLVAADERTAPSFLLESVEGGERQGRHSIMGSRPAVEVIAHAHRVEITTNARVPLFPHRSEPHDEPNPLLVMRTLSANLVLLTPPPRPGLRGNGLPTCFLGGWTGFAGYDTVRYTEPDKLTGTPPDDRNLPDMHFGFYDGVVVFDHVEKVVYVVQLAFLAPGADAGRVYDSAIAAIESRASEIQKHSKPLPAGRVEREPPARVLPSNMTRADHAVMIERAREYIKAGDIFQVVLGQRFERTSPADPFDVYRALRAVNPSPYMVYMQAKGCILVASSPEILCRVRRKDGALLVTNRPLAGTRRRGSSPAEDVALEKDLLADPKERAEHIMLVDLGRNDVGRVASPGSIALPAVMEVERYSHVMHISSTVTGELRPGLDSWDALAAALPVGTISGAPKIRAMQIIDELEPVKRGPYGGGMGYVGLDGQMDIALALRTMVVPTALHRGASWTYHLQASGGIVLDSVAEAEFQETVNKAAALARAIDVAEQAFGGG